MTNPVDRTETTPSEPRARTDSVLSRVRVAIGAIIVIAICVSVALAYRTGRANPESDSVASNPPRLSSQAVAQAQLGELTLAPEALQDLTPEQAREWNQRLPFSSERLQAAPRFIAPIDSEADYHRAVDCLTATIYYEAANESAEGKLAVAQVVLNRVRHPAFPNTVCGVVFEGSERRTGCQFTFTCDGALARPPSPAGWASAQSVAQAALNGMVSGTVGAATHYHASYVAPYWAPRLQKLAQVGTHIFYRFPGAWSASSALTSRYGRAEPVISKMSRFEREEAEVEPLTGSELVIVTTALPELRDDRALHPAVEDLAGTPPPPHTAPAAATTVTDAPPVAPAAVPQNPLVTEPTQRRPSRLARPDRW